MVKQKKFKYKLNPKYGQELYDIYGPEVIEKVQEGGNRKMSLKSLKFVKLMQLNKFSRNFIVSQLGFSYLGYLITLLDTLDYNNQVNFLYFRNFGVSDAMIKKLRKKFKDLGIVKKIGNTFYLNPEIAQKGGTLSEEVLELFKK